MAEPYLAATNATCATETCLGGKALLLKAQRKRRMGFTGQAATLESTGETFDTLTATRSPRAASAASR